MHKSRLTLYIIIALVLGVATGYVYNVKVFDDLNKKISVADANIKTFDGRLATIKDTTTAEYKQIKADKTKQATLRTDNNTARDNKLEGFNILSDIFLRLIKMIVGPLVFTTLVVGVA